MAKKSRKKRAATKREKGVKRGKTTKTTTTASVAAAPQRERNPISGFYVRAQPAPAAEPTAPITHDDGEVDVEVHTPTEREVEEALAAVREEQRASRRVSLAVEVHLASDSHFFSGLSGDISEGGLFLSTYRPLAVGSPVDLELSIPGVEESLHAKGEVRWLREHSTGQPQGVGIAFEELADDDRERINRFCTMRPPLYYEDVG